MEITRELLTGNITLTLEVYGTPEECDHPSRFKVCITPERLTQIRKMAAIVREHRGVDDLQLWSVRAWDYSGDWLNGTEDDDGELQLQEQEPERMECNAIMVSDDDLYWKAIVKNTDIRCETELVSIAKLAGTCICDTPPPPYQCPVHGERDERLRTTD